MVTEKNSRESRVKHIPGLIVWNEGFSPRGKKEEETKLSRRKKHSEVKVFFYPFVTVGRDIITVSGIRALALLMTDDASMMNGLKVNVSVCSTLGKYVRVGQHRPANGAYSFDILNTRR